MKKLLIFPLALLFSLSVSRAIDLNDLKIGFSMGYTPTSNDANIHFIDNHSMYCIACEFAEETIHGIYFGSTIKYVLYDGNKTSHNLIIRPVYESYATTVQKIETGPAILNGEIIEVEYFQDVDLDLSYINLDLLYSFDFANKHIGIFTGVSFAFTIDYDYTISEERAVIDGKVLVRNGAITGELKDVQKFSPTFVFGFEFPFDYWKINFIPHAMLRYPRRILDKEFEWDFMSYRLGVDVMFYLK